MEDTPRLKKAENALDTPARTRLDFSTLAGIVLALGGIIGGLLLEKGNILDIAQITAAMIVLGGTFGAVLVTTPMPVVLRAFRSVRGVFFEPSDSPSVLIERLIQLASTARKHGIVSLESEAAELPDPFLRKAMSLAVDGADLQELRHMMEIDLAMLEQAGEDEAKVWEAAGGYSPTIGIIGAVMGLIQVMKHLEDIKMVGHGIAVAFVATLYGVGAANIFFLPLAGKLRARVRGAVMLKEMALEGVAGIAQGLNPTLIRLKLESYTMPGKPDKPARPAKPAQASAKASAMEAAAPRA
jgi:chemotaxis protein MotA